jgi:hypothetical protein
MIIVNVNGGPNPLCPKCEGHGEVVYDNMQKTYQIFCGVMGFKDMGCHFKTPPRITVFECAQDWVDGTDLNDAIADGFYESEYFDKILDNSDGGYNKLFSD